jgi:hypothetical protein
VVVEDTMLVVDDGEDTAAVWLTLLVVQVDLKVAFWCTLNRGMERLVNLRLGSITTPPSNFSIALKSEIEIAVSELQVRFCYVAIR